MSDEKQGQPSEEELDELEDEIEHARRDSEEVKHGSFYEGDEYTVHDIEEESTSEE